MSPTSNLSPGSPPQPATTSGIGGGCRQAPDIPQRRIKSLRAVDRHNAILSEGIGLARSRELAPARNEQLSAMPWSRLAIAMRDERKPPRRQARRRLVVQAWARRAPPFTRKGKRRSGRNVGPVGRCSGLTWVVQTQETGSSNERRRPCADIV